MPGLDRKLTLYGLTMIAVGSCIGSGIFVTPYEVAATVPHQGIILLVWILGGLIALTGALTFAELGGMFPTAGGVYVFLREAYGPFAGFLYGWSSTPALWRRWALPLRSIFPFSTLFRLPPKSG
jgi:APA family basic amino acid/polyamine antiporter